MKKYKVGQIWVWKANPKERLKIVQVTGDAIWFRWDGAENIITEPTKDNSWHDESHPSHNKNDCFESAYTLDKKSVLKDILDKTENEI